MARIKVLNGAWTTVATLDADTVVGVEGGKVRLQTGDAAPAGALDGTLYSPGERQILCAGVTVYATAASNSAYVATMPVALPAAE